MSINLYPHQQRARDALLMCWANTNPSYWRALTIMPTGGGKTFTALAAARSWNASKGGNTRGLVLVQSKELLYQWARETRKVCPEWKVALVGDGQHRGWKRGRLPWKSNIIIASTQAASTRVILDGLETLGIDWMFIDEGHKSVTATHLRVAYHLANLKPDIRIGGLTATPERGDARGLKELYGAVASITQYDTLLRAGFIAKPIQVTMKDTRMESMFREWYQRAGDRRTIIFTRSVSEAWQWRRYWVDRGVASGVVDGDTPYSLRRYLEANCQVLFTVNVYTEGKDAPDIGAIVLAASSQRLRYMQRVGRGLRPDTKDCIIISPKHHNIFEKMTVRKAMGRKAPVPGHPKEVKRVVDTPFVGAISRFINWVSTLARRIKETDVMTTTTASRPKLNGIGLGTSFNGLASNDQLIEQLFKMRKLYEARFERAPNRIAVLEDKVWERIRDWCTEHGLLRIKSRGDGITLNKAMPAWLCYRDGGSASHYEAESVAEEEDDGPDMLDESFEFEDDADDGDVVEETTVEFESDPILYFDAEEMDIPFAEDEDWKLRIVFKSNPNVSYTYLGVCEDLVDDFMAAESKGEFYNNHIGVGVYEVVKEEFDMSQVDDDGDDE